MAILSEVFEKSICQYISSANYRSITYFSSLQKTRNRRLLPILNNPCKFSSTTFHCCRKSLSSSFCTDGVVTRIRFYPLLPNNNSNFLAAEYKRYQIEMMRSEHCIRVLRDDSVTYLSAMCCTICRAEARPYCFCFDFFASSSLQRTTPRETC